MRSALVALAVLPLVACAGIPKAPNTILVPCKVPAIERPDFAFDKLSPAADIFTKVKTLLSDRKARIAYETKLEAANESCRK